MKFIDLFSGVGGFTRGLELAGNECIGHCELDKFAEASYRSMHTITEEQRKYLLSLPLKKRQKEILKEEYLNGEWYESDITKARNIPRADIWTFGAPCQDFSIAGRRAGLDGGRSSLVREVFRLLGERQKEDRPEWIIYENVRGMLSSNRGRDYLEILASLDELGYDVEWQNINSKGGGTVYAVWSEKYGCYLAIRKLTPKECFRLQGWTDEYFEKAKEFNSDSQLYKQAGNGVTVDVVKAIGDKLKEQEYDYELPEGACLYSGDMDKVIACARCEEKMRFGDGYTSRHIHTVYGFGYAVCEKCYEKEWREERRK